MKTQLDNLLKEIEIEILSKKLNKKSIRILTSDLANELLKNSIDKLCSDLSVFEKSLNNSDFELCKLKLFLKFKQETINTLMLYLESVYKIKHTDNSKKLEEKLIKVSKSYKNIFKTENINQENILNNIPLETIDYLYSIDSDIKFIQNMFKFNNELDMFKEYIPLKTAYLILSDSDIKNYVQNLLNDKVKKAKEKLLSAIKLNLNKTYLSSVEIKKIIKELENTSLAFIYIQNSLNEHKINISKYVNENKIEFIESENFNDVLNIQDIEKQIYNQRYLKILKKYNINYSLWFNCVLLLKKKKGNYKWIIMITYQIF